MVTNRDINHRNNGFDLGDEGFCVLKGHEWSSGDQLTSSMEDYLEMICCMEEKGLPIQVSLLVQSLHVRPSSASRMLDNLGAGGYADFRKYGSVMVTDKGHEAGCYLPHRHRVLYDSFCALNYTDCELERVEKIKHFINRKTVENVGRIVTLFREIPQNAILKHALELYREILYNGGYVK